MNIDSDHTEIQELNNSHRNISDVYNSSELITPHLINYINGDSTELRFFDQYFQFPPELSFTRFSSPDEILAFLIQLIQNQKSVVPHSVPKALIIINAYSALDDVDLSPLYTNETIISLFIGCLSSPEKNIARTASNIITNLIITHESVLFCCIYYDIFNLIKQIIDPEFPEHSIYQLQSFLQASSKYVNSIFEHNESHPPEEQISLQQLWDFCIWLLNYIQLLKNENYPFQNQSKLANQIRLIFLSMKRILSFFIPPLDDILISIMLNIWELGSLALDGVFFLLFEIQKKYKETDFITIENQLYQSILPKILESPVSLQYSSPLLRFLAYEQKLPDNFMNYVILVLKNGEFNAKLSAIKYLNNIDEQLNENPYYFQMLVDNNIFESLSNIIASDFSEMKEEALFLAEKILKGLIAHEFPQKSIGTLPCFDDFLEEINELEISLSENPEVGNQEDLLIRIQHIQNLYSPEE